MFSKKLKALKPKLRTLSKEHLGDLSRRTKAIYHELCDCQMRTAHDPTLANMEAESVVYRRWQLLADLEERYLKQKSKLHWLNVCPHFHPIFLALKACLRCQVE